MTLTTSTQNTTTERALTWSDGQEEHELRPLDVPDGAVIGWRTERLDFHRSTTTVEPGYREAHVPGGLRPRNARRYARLPFGDVDDDGRYPVATCDLAVRPLMGQAGAVSFLDRPHTTPDPKCQCGLRVVPNLTSLMDYWYDQVMQLRARADMKKTALPPMALCRVIGSGVVAESGPRYDDPRGSWRVSHAQIVGTVILPGTGVGRAARRHLQRIRTVDEVHYVDDILDVDGG